jgi:hypothetical protein
MSLEHVLIYYGVFFSSGGAGTVQELKRDIHGLIAAKTNFHLGKKNII